MTTGAEIRLIDSHIHLDAWMEHHPATSLELMWQRAQQHGVLSAITVSTRPENFRTVRDISGALCIGFAVGIHPQEVYRMSDDDLELAFEQIESFLQHPQCTAIGECGLDGHFPDLARQKQVLQRHVKLSQESGLPLSLHAHGAYGLLCEELGRSGNVHLGVIHGFSSSIEMAKRFIHHGLYVSLAGAITRSNARKLATVACHVPMNRLLIETDSPYQPTGSDRRDRTWGSPEDLITVAHTIARIRGEPLEAIARNTTANAFRLFPKLAAMVELSAHKVDVV